MQYYQTDTVNKEFGSKNKIIWLMNKSKIKSYIKKFNFTKDTFDIVYKYEEQEYEISIFVENNKPSYIYSFNENEHLVRRINKINLKIDLFDKLEDVVYVLSNSIINLSKNKSVVKQEKNILQKNILEFKEQVEKLKPQLKKHVLSSNIMSVSSIVEMLGDQIIKIQTNSNYLIENLTDLQNFTVKMTNFKLKNNKSDLEVYLTIKLSNNFISEPPTLKLKSNYILKNNIFSVIEKLAPFTDKTKWSIKYSVYSMINNIYQMINKYGELDTISKSELDSLLIELEYLLSIKTENISQNKLLLEFDEMLANELAGFVQTNKKNKTYWKSGTGYGSSESSTWNVEDYTKAIKLRKTKINEKMTTLFKMLNNELIVQNISQLKSIFKVYLLDDETDNLILISIADIVFENNDLFVDQTGIFIIKNIQDYCSDNKITHNISNIKLIKPSVELTDYQKKFDEFKFKYSDTEFKSFHYSSESICALTSSQVSRLQKEFRILKKSIILHPDASIFFCIEKNNVNKIRFIISGPKKTPYELGLFIFDMCMSNNFPSSPPLVNLSNHGNKRFNPNLYACGKVCLSLLGTWRGDKSEMWNSTISTLYQLLISIQSQILVDEPYFNEPGHERGIGTPSGIACSKDYNYNIRQFTVDHAMCDLLENSNYPEFSTVIKKYFIEHKESIIKTLDMWLEEMPSSRVVAFKKSCDKFITLVKS